MSVLTDVLPATARKYLYAAYSLAVIVVGALAVADLDVGKAPDVLAYLGGALGLVAASNVTAVNDTPPHDAGRTDVLTAALVVLVIVVVLVVLL